MDKEPVADRNHQRRQAAIYLAQVLALAAAHLIGVKLGRLFPSEYGPFSPVRLPSGVMLAALVYRRSLWPGVLLGSLLSGMFIRGAPLPYNASIALVNLIEPLLGAWLLDKARFAGFGKLRSVLAYVCVILATTGLTAALGTGTVALYTSGRQTHFFPIWKIWWTGNVLGSLVLGGALLSWRGSRLRWPPRLRVLEGLSLSALIAATAHLAFGTLPRATAQPFSFLLFPVLLWAALRFGARGVTAAAVAASLIGVHDVTSLLVGEPSAAVWDKLLLLQVFSFVFAVTGLVLSAIIEERAAAEEQSRLLLSAIKSSADGVLIGETPQTSMSEARILFANDAFGRMLGRGAEGLIGQPLSVLRQAGTTDSLDLHSASALKRSVPVSGEFSVKSPAGERHIEWQLSPVVDAAGQSRHFVNVQRDVTARRAAERALRWNEALLRTVTAATPLAFFVVDERNDSILYFNQRFCDLWGIEDLKEGMRKGKVSAQQVFEHSKWLVRDPEAMQKKLEDERLSREAIREDEVECLDGRTLRRFSTQICDAEGRYFGRLRIFEDVTARKAAQSDLFRSRERYRALVSSLPDTILRVSALGKLLDVYAPGTCSLLSQPPEQLVGKYVREALPASLAGSLSAAKHRALEGGGAQAVDERITTRDGERLFELRVVRSGPDEVLAILRDVTELHGMQAKLFLSDRMASVGTLAAGVAHEINNPLSFVIANQTLTLEALEELSRERPCQQVSESIELLREAAEGTDRVRRIVRDLKIFSRHDDESLGPVDLRHAMDRAIALAWNEIRHKARLVKAYGEVPLILANEARLGQVFLNLMINAAQAIADGDADANEIRVSTRVEGQSAILEVRDTGSGIAPEHLTRIFDPFFTTKPVGVGTGLGLAICHQIVRTQGGEITVDSTLGKGTCFRIVLPLDHASLKADKQKRLPSDPPPPRRSSVLVVDDEVMLSRSLSRLLGGEHDVEAINSGAEALRLVGTGRRFDVILCDLMMPELSGMELYNELGQLAPDLARRMVFLTGGACTTGARDFLSRVQNPRLEKPFNLDELKKVVRTMATALP